MLDTKVRYRRKTADRISCFSALLVISILGVGLAGCSGVVSGNGGGSGTGSGSGTPNSLAITNVQASTPTNTGFQVSWSTNVAANSDIDYGTSASYGSSTPVNSAMVTSHQAAVTNLTAGTLYHFRVRSTDASNSSAASGDQTFATAGDTTGPTVSITSPAANATLSGTVNVDVAASDNVGVKSVQLKIDNANSGAAVTAAPYVIAVNTSSLSNGNHILTAVASDAAGNSATSNAVAVKASNTATDTTPPTVSMTAPANGATVSGTISITANANDNVGVASVQFQLDGANFGGLDTASPYSVSWNTATSSNGSHTLRAIVKDAAGNSTTSASVTVTVSNGAPDTTPPSVPTGLTATAASSSQINLTWTASTDNVGVTGYNVFRGGTKIGTSPNPSFQDGGLAASTSFTYNVAAFDAAGNTSAQSAGASATTLTASSGGGIPSALGWYDIPNTKIQPLCPSYSDIQENTGCVAVMSAWNGGLFDTKRNRFIIHGGGHADYAGNEVYAIDLNANPIAPVLLHDASHGAGISNLGSCPDTFTDGNPVSAHSYGGLLYLPNQDLYLRQGGSKASCGNFTYFTWNYNPASNTWALASSAHENGNGSPPTTAYDSVTGKVYEGVHNTGDFLSYDPVAKAWAILGVFTINCSATGSTQTAAIDPVRRFYFCIGDGELKRTPLSAPYAATNLTSTATGCSTVINATGPGWVYDPVQKLMVGWAGGNSAYLYNPDTNSCSTVTYPGGPPSVQSNGTYGRFQYSPQSGVFVVANDIGTDVYTLRLMPASGSSGPVISGIAATSITTNATTIVWTTDVGASSQGEYGTTTSYGTATTLDSTLLTSHAVTLTGLSTGTLYHYRVHSKNSSGVESISGDFAFSTNNTIDTTPPSVSVTAPASGATVSGTVIVSANASDNVGVTSVQFLLEGANLGGTITTSPYSTSWDTTTATNASHTLSAQARDAAGNVGTAVPVAVTVSNSTQSALQDFQNRCAAAGVIVCQGFDDPAVFTHLNAGSLHSGSYPGSVGYGTQDTTNAASGAGSLMFTVPSFGDADPNGYWKQLFTPDINAGVGSATMFSQNSTFYVQYRQRFSPEYLTNVWPVSGGGTTYWKQQIIANYSSSCGPIELTTVNVSSIGFPRMYSRCGADNLIVDIGNSDFLLEQGDTATTGYNCHYQAGLNGPNSCARYTPNKWYTYYYKIKIGTWDTPTSTIQAWVAVDGGPYIQWLNIQNHSLSDSSPTGSEYNTIYLLPYMTNRDSSISAGPTAFTWYDELIVSSQPVAAPKN